jgi:acetyl-CoA carboxylase biotin carboxyl carrier protein
MDLTDADVSAILKLLESSAFGDLELETPEFRLTLRRTEGGEWTRESATLRSPQLLRPATPPRAPVADDAQPASAAQAAQAAEPRSDLVDVRTPLPGTFYRSPKPGAPPFVELGAPVGANTVIAIVETMKLMNSVYAGVAGRVAEICMGDGTLAQQDAVLMRIAADPSAADPSAAAPPAADSP